MVDWSSSGGEQLAVSDFLGRVAINYEFEGEWEEGAGESVSTGAVSDVKELLTGCVIVKEEQRLGGGAGGQVPMDDRMEVIVLRSNNWCNSDDER
jgi:hypothetical protein